MGVQVGLLRWEWTDHTHKKLRAIWGYAYPYGSPQWNCVKHYAVRWQYYVWDGPQHWIVGKKEEVAKSEDFSDMTSEYDVPDDAFWVSINVAPVLDTSLAGCVLENAFGDFATSDQLPDWASLTLERGIHPEKPGSVSTEIQGNTLIATINNYNEHYANYVTFHTILDDYSDYSHYTVSINKYLGGIARLTLTLVRGRKYKIRARGCYMADGGHYSDWGDWSDWITLAPPSPKKVEQLYAESETLVVIKCTAVQTATEYETQWTKDKKYFDSGNSELVSSATNTTNIIRCSVTTGEKYYFRIRAKNSTGDSEWIYASKPIAVGKKPSPPTTWTLRSRFMVDDDVILYWTHNTEDGSEQTEAYIDLKIDGVANPITVTGKTAYKSIKSILSSYPSGCVITWRVKTKGIIDTYSDYSTTREIKVFAAPTAQLIYLPNTQQSGNDLYVIDTFPVKLKCICGPERQNIVGATLNVISKSNYKSKGMDGEEKPVVIGEEIYSKYIYDITDHTFYIDLLPSELHLETDITISINIDVAMDSGLVAHAEKEISTHFIDNHVLLSMFVGIDKKNYTACLSPIVQDISDIDPESEMTDIPLAENYIISIYRRSYNGELELVQDNIENNGATSIIDPHPSLKDCMYRIVATNTETGLIEWQNVYVDGINDPCILIQWNESYKTITDMPVSNDVLLEPLYQGSFVRLPYNIKTSEQNDIQKTLVSYIGRKRPVSYYGTQLGETATFNCDIDKEDSETIYQLRRLAIYTGNVYLREPSGMGYWASINVSFNKSYDSLIVPVTINVTRVEGETK